MFMRKILLLSAALPVLALGISPALAVDIEDARTDPIDSQTIDNGNPGDIVVLTAGSVLVGEGNAALTLNSNNNITNQGTIGSTDANDTTGILIAGAVTGEIINSSLIRLDEDFTGTDEDKDGDFDTPFAQGSNRVGILVEGSSVFTGNINNDGTGQIRIEGNDSAGILVAGAMTGDLVNQGSISVTGDRSSAIVIAGTLNGDVSNQGRIDAQGEASHGIQITGDVNGTVVNQGTVTATGYRSTLRLGADTREALDADDLLQGGSAIAVGANVTGGILNNSFTDDNDNLVRGNIRSDGSSPALLVAGSVDGVDNGDTLIGAVGTAEDDENYGIINRAIIAANGVNDGFSATGIRVEGTDFDGTMRRAIIEGGILSTGTIDVDSFEANGTAISVGDGGVVPLIDVRGVTLVDTLSQTGGRAAGIVIEAGAQVNEVRVNTLIQTTYTGTGIGGFAAGVVDESGTVDLLLNNGRIITRFTEVISSGNEADPNDTTRRRVAVDLSANGNGATLRQITAVDDDPDDGVDPLTPEIDGDILFGSGNDILELAGGKISGDILFGDGDDLLVIDNGAELSGALFDTDGMLTLDVRDGLLALGSDTNLALTTATFGSNGRLQLTIDPGNGGGIESATFNASGAVTFLDGARIAPILSGLIGDGGTFDLISAGSFNFANSFSDMLDAESLPFLYNINLTQDSVSGDLIVTLNRRNATELGMDVNQAAAYEAWFDAISTSTDASMAAGFAGLSASADFFAAYDQLLPEYGAAALQFTLANTDGTTGAIGNRLDALRRGYGPGGGVWVQEIGYYMDRNRSSISQPYDGYGLGLAMGMDQPMLGFDAMGIALSGFSNQIEQSEGFDTPLSSVSVQLGGYAGRKFGGFDFITHSAIGIDWFDSERKLTLGSVVRSSVADWRAYHIASTTRLSRDFQVGKWLFSPSIAMDYLRLTEEGYKETGGGIGVDLALDSRVSESMSGTAALTMGRRFGNDRSWWAPRLRVGVRNDFRGDASVTTARFNGFNTRFSLTPETLPDTAVLFGFSLTAGSRYTSFGFDYDADIREGFTRHTGKIVIRFIF
jgi:uncharacterized protein with beta-barrel porin domain